MSDINKHKNISILGLGWLGQPLADVFKTLGFSVSGTTRNLGKHKKFNEQNITAVLFDIYANDPLELPADFFTDSHLVLNIPPGRKNLDAKLYTQKMTALVDFAFAQNLTQLVFISTTSVYGSTNGEITNNTARAPVTASAIAHCKIEDHCIRHYAEKVSILRPSGLVGGNRHPALTLSGKTGITQGNNPVNLVHRDDVISAIVSLVKNQIGGKALNLCSLQHPSRAEYYPWCAAQLGLPAPVFDHDHRSDSQLGKKIMAQQTFEVLNMTVKYPSPYDMLDKF